MVRGGGEHSARIHPPSSFRVPRAHARRRVRSRQLSLFHPGLDGDIWPKTRPVSTPDTPCALYCSMLSLHRFSASHDTQISRVKTRNSYGGRCVERGTRAHFSRRRFRHHNAPRRHVMNIFWAHHVKKAMVRITLRYESRMQSPSGVKVARTWYPTTSAPCGCCCS